MYVIAGVLGMKESWGCPRHSGLPSRVVTFARNELRQGVHRRDFCGRARDRQRLGGPKRLVTRFIRLDRQWNSPYAYLGGPGGESIKKLS